MIKNCVLCGKEIIVKGRGKYCGNRNTKNGCAWIAKKETFKRFRKKNPKRSTEYYQKNKERIIRRHKERLETDILYFKKYKERLRKQRKKKRERELKLRFKIFQRDNFTCQYCGRKAPEVELQIDHKYPKNKGGLNKEINYITACKECNLGKGDIILNEFNK